MLYSCTHMATVGVKGLIGGRRLAPQPWSLSTHSAAAAAAMEWWNQLLPTSHSTTVHHTAADIVPGRCDESQVSDLVHSLNFIGDVYMRFRL